MSLNQYYKPIWYEYFAFNNEADFIELFVPLLFNRDKSKDWLNTLHIAYLHRNQYRGEKILDYLLNIPELVELDSLQRDKFQSLPHQVTPLRITTLIE